MARTAHARPEQTNSLTQAKSCAPVLSLVKARRERDQEKQAPTQIHVNTLDDETENDLRHSMKCLQGMFKGINESLELLPLERRLSIRGDLNRLLGSMHVQQVSAIPLRKREADISETRLNCVIATLESLQEDFDGLVEAMNVAAVRNEISMFRLKLSVLIPSIETIKEDFACLSASVKGVRHAG